MTRPGIEPRSHGPLANTLPTIHWKICKYDGMPKSEKWYLIPPCLTLRIIRYGSRVKWSNPGKGVAPSPGVVAIEKGAFRSPSAKIAKFTYLQ